MLGLFFSSRRGGLVARVRVRVRVSSPHLVNFITANGQQLAPLPGGAED